MNDLYVFKRKQFYTFCRYYLRNIQLMMPKSNFGNPNNTDNLYLDNLLSDLYRRILHGTNKHSGRLLYHMCTGLFRHNSHCLLGTDGYKTLPLDLNSYQSVDLKEVHKIYFHTENFRTINCNNQSTFLRCYEEDSRKFHSFWHILVEGRKSK